MGIDKRLSIPVPEFRKLLKVAFILLKDISEIKRNGNNDELLKAKKEELSTIYSAVSNPELVSLVQMKLRKIQKKRERERKQKILRSAEKQRLEQLTSEQHEKIDRWLDSVKKKDLQVKRENELKKEADSIMSEVKKKISEAKHNLDKITALEKLRNARKGNSLAKGLFVPAKYETLFKEKISPLKATMQKQLIIYEAEEKALSVMLETEHEGQREEERSRKIKKLTQIQAARQRKILQCLFGSPDEPSTSDPKYFYWKQYTSASDNLDSLLKIRYQWDSFLVPSGCPESSTVPQKWVVPDLPSSEIWETALQTDRNYHKEYM